MLDELMNLATTESKMDFTAFTLSSTLILIGISVYSYFMLRKSIEEFKKNNILKDLRNGKKR